MPLLRPLLITLPLLLGGCAAAIDYYSGRHRDALAPEQTQASIREALGTVQPCEAGPDDRKQGAVSCDRFDVLGKVARRDDGNAQATASAVTLGLGELILVPMTVVSVTADYTHRHTVTVYYDEKRHYLFHTLLDGAGQVRRQ